MVLLRGFLLLLDLLDRGLDPRGIRDLVLEADLAVQGAGAIVVHHQALVGQGAAIGQVVTVTGRDVAVAAAKIAFVEIGSAETDRRIISDLELDIREAPLREWEIEIPADHAVASVTGAEVADYAVASEVKDGKRRLKIIFKQPVIDRQLISVRLEKNEAAKVAESIDHGTIVFIVCDGGWKYLSTGAYTDDLDAAEAKAEQIIYF